MTRPLYLDGSPAGPLHVLRDGPALCVRRDGLADRLFPFARISRIVVSGAVEWETAALLEVLEQGIPIVFLGRHGHVRGYCLGAQPRRAGLEARIEAFLDRPDWAERYADWYRAAERRSVLWIVRRLRLPEDDLRAGAVRKRIDAVLARHVPLQQVHRGRALLQGWHQGLVAELFAAEGVGGATLVGRREGLNLIHDFTRIVGWEINLALQHCVAWLAKRRGQTSFDEPKGRRRLLNEFEGWNAHLRDRHRRLIDGFTLWLGDLA
jgi:hypothetical protein